MLNIAIAPRCTYSKFEYKDREIHKKRLLAVCLRFSVSARPKNRSIKTLYNIISVERFKFENNLMSYTNNISLMTVPQQSFTII